jgi:hypothetical protein
MRGRVARVKREYDEAGYLKHYIFRWHGDLIPEDDKYPSEDYFKATAPSASPEDITPILSDGDLEVADPEIEKALLGAWDDFNAAVCKRVLNEHKLTVRRCPQCNRILESPRAKVCLWCDYNEHKSAKGSAVEC